MWEIKPSRVSGTYCKKQEMGSDFHFSPGTGALLRTGLANMNQPLLA